jgi:DNA-binding XRE family transcriptional regulator
MTKNETLALEWIKKTTNLSAEQIKHGHHISPDFICPDDLAFEVKTIIYNTMIFSSSQIPALNQFTRCFILGWENNSQIPKVIIPFSLRVISDGIYNDYKLTVLQNRNIHNNLKMIRRSRHMTAQQLADLAYISIKTIFQLESGKNYPQKPIMRALAKALDVKVGDLGFNGKKPS